MDLSGLVSGAVPSCEGVPERASTLASRGSFLAQWALYREVAALDQLWGTARDDRPVVFYPYDLEAYRARRGFYFDYEAVAPGPVASSFDDLLAGLDRALDPADDCHAAHREDIRKRLLGGDPASTDGSVPAASGRSTDPVRSAPRSTAVRGRLSRGRGESRRLRPNT